MVVKLRQAGGQGRIRRCNIGRLITFGGYKPHDKELYVFVDGMYDDKIYAHGTIYIAFKGLIIDKIITDVICFDKNGRFYPVYVNSEKLKAKFARHLKSIGLTK